MQARAWAPGLGFWDLKPGPSPLQALVQVGLGSAGSGLEAQPSTSLAETERLHIQELINKYGYELRDIFNMDETGLFYAYVFLCSSLSTYPCLLWIECLPIVLSLTNDILVWKVVKSGWPMHSLQMQTGQRNCHLSSLAKQTNLGRLIERVAHNLDSIIGTMQRLGWQHPYIRSGFRIGIAS